MIRAILTNSSMHAGYSTEASEYHCIKELPHHAITRLNGLLHGLHAEATIATTIYLLACMVYLGPMQFL